MASASSKPVTFIITKTPRREAQRKTLLRLMRMQPDISAALRKLALRRKRTLNQDHQRGGRMWTVRVRATRLARVEPGATFTVNVTPQLAPDLKSV